MNRKNYFSQKNCVCDDCDAYVMIIEICDDLYDNVQMLTNSVIVMCKVI